MAEEERSLGELLADPKTRAMAAEKIRATARYFGHDPEHTEREIARRIRAADARTKGGERG